MLSACKSITRCCASAPGPAAVPTAGVPPHAGGVRCGDLEPGAAARGGGPEPAADGDGGAPRARPPAGSAPRRHRRCAAQRQVGLVADKTCVHMCPGDVQGESEAVGALTSSFGRVAGCFVSKHLHATVHCAPSLDREPIMNDATCREVHTSILAEATAVLQRRAARLEATSPERPYHLLYALHSQVTTSFRTDHMHLNPSLHTFPPVMPSRCSAWACAACTNNCVRQGTVCLQRGAHAAAAGAMLAWARRLEAGNPADAASLHDIEVALGALLLR